MAQLCLSRRMSAMGRKLPLDKKAVLQGALCASPSRMTRRIPDRYSHACMASASRAYARALDHELCELSPSLHRSPLRTFADIRRLFDDAGQVRSPQLGPRG